MYFGSCSLHLLHDDTFRRLCRARDLLADRFQQPIALHDAAKEACFSPFHFHRSFTAAFGMTPHEFLTLRRIDLAKRLLARGEMSVTEVCMEAGYASLGSFSAKFHSVVGSSPSEYQREIRRAFGFAAPWRIAFVPVCFLGRFAGLQY